jgi:hypothetical protein
MEGGERTIKHSEQMAILDLRVNKLAVGWRTNGNKKVFSLPMSMVYWIPFWMVVIIYPSIERQSLLLSLS